MFAYTLVLSAILASLCAAQGSAQPPLPSPPWQFIANVVEGIHSSTKSVLVGTIYADWTQNRVRFDYTTFGGIFSQFEDYNSRIASFVIINNDFSATCTNVSITWPSLSPTMFKHAHYVGRRELSGRDCHVWLVVDKQDDYFYTYFDVHSNDVVATSLVSPALNYTLVYANVVANPPPASMMATPAICYPAPSA